MGEATFKKSWATVDQWSYHRDELARLYLEENMPIRKIKELMLSQHDFHATERMFKYWFKKWDLRKNITINEARDIAQILQQRQESGKATEIWKGNKKVDYRHRVVRHLKRYGTSAGQTGKKTSPSSQQSTNRKASSGPVVRAITPPPSPHLYLRIPEKLRRVELALSSMRMWIGANAHNPTWCPSRIDLAAGLDCFPVFVNALRNLSRNVDPDRCFGDINLAFANVRSVFSKEHPVVLLRLVLTLVAYKEYPSSLICLQLCRTLLNYLRQMSMLVLTPQHPINTIWPLFEAYMDCPDDTEELARFAASIKDAAQRCFKPDMFWYTCTTLYAETFERCIGTHHGQQQTGSALCVRKGKSIFEAALQEQQIMIPVLSASLLQQGMLDSSRALAVEGGYLFQSLPNGAGERRLCRIGRMHVSVENQQATLYALKEMAEYTLRMYSTQP